jgi:hypothetical protein
MKIKIVGQGERFNPDLLNVKKVLRVSDKITAVYLGSPQYKYLEYSSFMGTDTGVNFRVYEDDGDMEYLNICFDIDNADYFVMALKWEYVIFVIEDLFGEHEEVDFNVEVVEYVRGNNRV